MLLGDIIKQYREEHQMSLQDFANLIGTSRSYIHMLEKNVNPSTNKPINPSIETLKLLANAMNMDLDFLLKQLDSEQQIYLNEEEYKKQFEKTDVLGNPVASIPLLGSVKAGYNYLAQENWIGTVDVETSLVGDGKDFFALNVKGDSMAPVFIEDDIVIVKKQSNCENNEFAIVIINGDEGTLKKIKKTDNGIILQPLNPAYRTCYVYKRRNGNNTSSYSWHCKTIEEGVLEVLWQGHSEKEGKIVIILNICVMANVIANLSKLILHLMPKQSWLCLLQRWKRVFIFLQI